MASRVIEVEVCGRTRRVTVDGLDGTPGRVRVTWDDTTHVVDARYLDPQTLSLVEVGEGTDSHVVRLVKRAAPGEFDIHLEGTAIRALVDGRRAYRGSSRADAADGAQEIVAPMPGKVVRQLVEVGDQVVAGQGVIVVEAMKMENELTARREGLIKEILVAEGTSVEAGKVLVVIE